MGEHKRPKAAPLPPQRPSAAIFAMRGSVAAWKSGVMGASDPETNEFMADLDRVIAWIDHLEAPPPKPDA